MALEPDPPWLMRHSVLVCSRLIFVRPGGVVVASVGDEGARFGVALEGLTEYFLAGRGRLQVVWLGRVLIAHQGNSPGEMFPDAGGGDAWIPDLLRKGLPARIRHMDGWTWTRTPGE